MTAKVRIYIASSLDGFIAGDDNDLSWLSNADGTPFETTGEGIDYETFIGGVGALLMGRSTYDTVAGFGIDWPYGDIPVLVATHRGLEDRPAAVEPVEGTIEELVAEAKKAAGDKDVYLDGGNLIRQALDAGLIDELVVTLVPIILGRGQPLFAGTANRHHLELVDRCDFGSGLTQLRLRPRR